MYGIPTSMLTSRLAAADGGVTGALQNVHSNSSRSSDRDSVSPTSVAAAAAAAGQGTALISPRVSASRVLAR